MPSKEIPHPKKLTKSGGLLGRTTILILSSYLIGVGSSHRVAAGLEIYMLLAGLCGVVGFYGLEFVGRRREERALQAAYEQAAVKLKELMERERHIRSEPKTKTSDSAQQPLAAVDSH